MLAKMLTLPVNFQLLGFVSLRKIHSGMHTKAVKFGMATFISQQHFNYVRAVSEYE